ncbi:MULTISPECIES: hypothetical protein [unclassified Bradyrhizobium]
MELSAKNRADHAATLHMRALVHESLKRFEEADNQRAIELDPADANTCTNLANVLQDLGLFVLAQNSLR